MSEFTPIGIRERIPCLTHPLEGISKYYMDGDPPPTIKDFHRRFPPISMPTETPSPCASVIPSKLSLILEHHHSKDDFGSQRSALNRICCKVSKTVCSLIIDSDSQKKLVSATMVEQLRLSTKPLMHKFKLNWLSTAGIFAANLKIQDQV